MNYEEALKRWGATKLSEYAVATIIDRTVSVSISYDDGAGGCDTCGPGARVYVEISGQDNSGRWLNREVDAYDFTSILHEIVVAGGGSLSD